RLHRALAADIAAHGLDLVFCAGPLMAALWKALAPACRGAHAPSAQALEGEITAAIRGGDAVMVKGSLGSRMGPLVKALERRYAPPAPDGPEGPEKVQTF
ncbi:MAG: UDP-N-acetylmuramoylalanyl-D-glutamyl-2, 6-diaminopimelate--D-alanyl-D-alanine ligase, partial [Proteobacteria bacterium]|nr:UDP-N-acetylmuramoylalanyl-D-glutamyl-2, 6-diaminopimelate--D-alanyl-D-alanine ligase [Pseudomonadota bacterium]